MKKKKWGFFCFDFGFFWSNIMEMKSQMRESENVSSHQSPGRGGVVKIKVAQNVFERLEFGSGIF